MCWDFFAIFTGPQRTLRLSLVVIEQNLNHKLRQGMAKIALSDEAASFEIALARARPLSISRS